ncbi:MAG: 75 kDa chloroplast membrane translocon [Monoraphidium minutum]|nr:MAG: 75 kDa chloroplast membrane translocon [Monoraphidium minutum]
MAGSWAVAFPGLGGGGGGGAGGAGGSGGGGGGWWGHGGGGGGEGFGANPAFDLAAAAAAASGAGGDKDKKAKKKKQQQQQQPDEDDLEAAAEDALLEEAEEPSEDAGAAPAAGRGAAGALVTSDGELEEMMAEAGVDDGKRHGTRRCVEVVVEGWPEVGALPKMNELKDMLSVQEGFIFDYQDVVDDRRKLELQYDEYIANVDIRTEYVDDKSNHQRVIYKFRPYVFEGIDTIEIKNATLMPQRVADEIVKGCLPDHAYRVEIGLMDKVREKIEKWYQDRGLPFCYVGYFDGMEEGTLRANVIEAKVNDVAVRYERPRAGGDESEALDIYSQGEVVPAERIISAAGFKKGEHYHIDDGQDAINNIYACGLIEEINIEPEQDMTDPSKINIKVVVEEVQPRSMEMNLDWAFALKDGVPQLSRQSLIPGGSVEVSHENLFGDSQSLSVSLSASDWRNPAADLGFQMSYTEPFYKPNTTRNLQVFNTRKMSPIFTPGAEPDVPPVFVDRFGAKAWTSHVGGQDNKVEHALLLQQIQTVDENGQPVSKDNKVEHALLLQQVQTVDENGQPVSKGTKVARGYYADNGPPTTLSGNGRDVSLSYQGFAALDDVQFVNGNQLGRRLLLQFVNGNQLGRRLLLQVDQGLNVKLPLPGGRALGFGGGVYNRVTATFTKFMQLPGLRKLTDDDVWLRRRAPNTLVLHARGGNCVGDMASYDYFALGGPYSVRGYSPGELGACRRFAELAAEVRVPLKNHSAKLPGTAYAFAEYGTDLGSGRSLQGSPTEYYRKAGRGATYGAGLKALGACRFEYARDCNAGTGSWFVHWGERF